MWPIVVIALNTFRENLRDRILYNLLLFAVLLMGASMLLADLTITEHYKIITDMGLAAINFVGIVIAVFVGIGLVSKEIERRTIYTIVARPISRMQFIIGKYLGLITTLVVNVTFMLSVFLLTLWIYRAPVHWALVQAVQLIVVELMLVTAIALFFSTFTSATLSAIFTIGLYIIGHLTTDLRGIAQKSQSEVIKVVADGVYYLCPNLDMLNMKGPAATGVAIALSYEALATLYGLLYAGMLIVGACLVFQRRDF
jgi:ABC-type transport system involved in multi-copper enzyme maturation permease subunit